MVTENIKRILEFGIFTGCCVMPQLEFAIATNEELILLCHFIDCPEVTQRAKEIWDKRWEIINGK